MTLEKRSFEAAEIRAKGRKLQGYAALFGTEARIGGDLVETIAPGAFSETLAARADILALVDHDPARLLARTKSGTLRLTQDARGLAFDLDVPETQAGRDVLALAERGDLGGMSFGFTVRDEHLEGNRRELRAVDLFEISVVAAFPAYEGTEINARAKPASFPARDHATRTLLTTEARKRLFIEHDLAGLLRGDLKARYEAYRVGRVIALQHFERCPVFGGWFAGRQDPCTAHCPVNSAPSIRFISRTFSSFSRPLSPSKSKGRTLSVFWPPLRCCRR